MAFEFRIPLALRILAHHPGRLMVSLAGIVLAVCLMFSQDGFRNALFDSQAELIRRLDADLIIANKLKYLLFVDEPFTGRRLAQARAVPGVGAVCPLYIEPGRGSWKSPRDSTTRPVRVVAFDVDDAVVDFPAVARLAGALKRRDTVLFDERSRDYYGNPRAGSRAELAGRAVEVVGTFRLGSDFVTDGSLIMSDRNFERVFPDRRGLARVDLAVVHLAPGADRAEVRRRLLGALPDDVVVMTKAELVDLEIRYWRDNSAVGYVFTLGLVVGVAVGVIICYQILYTNVLAYLPQFATLKAMGYTDRYLVGVVLLQGLFLAALGFVPAALAARGLFAVVGSLTGLVMFLTPSRCAFILVLTVAMCAASGAIAVRKVLTADPAEVFR
jgi:putative ABC transport system permease protein